MRPLTTRFVRTCVLVLCFTSGLMSCASLPNTITVLRDQAYGSQPRQKLDIYSPPGARGAPVIFMVHGGGWLWGDKAAYSVVVNKVNRWVNKGIVFISANYRLVPDANPIQQAKDIGSALGYAQKLAARWGADPSKFVLMGHSAGAHLVSLLAADPKLAYEQGAKPWLGTVVIDSGGFDIDQIMRSGKELGFYKKAFGNDPQYWIKASPIYRLTQKQAPLLAICSKIRKDKPCIQARAFQAKAKALGMRVDVLPVNLSHWKTNLDLGEDNAYTRDVEKFLASLDPTFRSRLKH